MEQRKKFSAGRLWFTVNGGNRTFNLALAAVDQMLDEVARTDLRYLPHMMPVRKKLLERALGFYQKLLQEKDDDTSLLDENGHAYYRLAAAEHLLSQYEQAEQNYLKSIAIRKRLCAESPDNRSYARKLGKSYYYLATLLATTNDRRNDARKYFQCAAPIFARLAKQSSDTTARYYYAQVIIELAAVGGENAPIRDLVDAYGEALPILEDLADSYPKTHKYANYLASSYKALANVHASRKHKIKAEVLFQKAIVILQHLQKATPGNPRYSPQSNANIHRPGTHVSPHEGVPGGALRLSKGHTNSGTCR